MSVTSEALQKILNAAPTGTKTYALMDAALDSTIYHTIKTNGSTYANLYTLSWQQPLEDIAPYAVELAPQSTFYQELLTWDWYANWGYFIQSPASLEQLSASFAPLTIAQLQNGTQGFFRFYDPRVIRPFLESASSTQLNIFFAKASRLVVPMLDDGLQGEGAIIYTVTNGALNQTENRFTE